MATMTATQVFAECRGRAKVTRQPGTWTDGRIVVVADRRDGGRWQYNVGTMAKQHGYGRAAVMRPILDALLSDGATNTGTTAYAVPRCEEHADCDEADIKASEEGRESADHGPRWAQ